MNVLRKPSVGLAPTFRSLLPALLPCLTLTALAQTTRPDPAASATPLRVPTTTDVAQADRGVGRASGDTLTLSPFEVRGEEDSGYQATSTLAGTRLRSNLKDLAASISVVTKDFMTDVNATDLSSLLIYTLGTEVAGYSGNFSGLSSPNAGGEFNDVIGQASPGTRVRGLIDADRTRDFFLTDVPMDTYNIDRVDITRGANAILFGLGSPAGIVNSGLIKANIARTKGTVGVSVDNNGTARGTLDYNQVLLPDKLAFRFASVWDEHKYRIEEAFERKKALTMTGTWKPFANTTIRATTEFGRDDSNRPNMRPPWDQFSWWWAAGKPVWDPTGADGGKGRLLGTPSGVFTPTTVFSATGARQSANYLTANMGSWRSNQLGLLYQDPNSAKFGGVNIGGGQTVDAIEGFADRAYVNAAGTAQVNGGVLGLNTWTNVIQRLNHGLGSANPDPLASFYNKDPQVTDPNVFDFYHHDLNGPIKYEWARWSTYNASIEQTFLEGKAGIELAVDKQALDNGYTSPLDYRINMDINEKLPNGAPNPNLGRLMTAGGGFKRVLTEDRQAFRATGFYQLDLQDKGPQWLGYILGHHVLQANYMSQKHYHEKLGGTVLNNNLDYGAADPTFTPPGAVSSTARLMALVHYLGDSMVSTTDYSQARFQGITAFQDPSGSSTINALFNPRPVSTAASAVVPWKTQQFSIITNGKYDVNGAVRAAAGYADRTREKVKSSSGVLQSFWLGGNLVSTLGWRRDQVSNYDAGVATQTALGTAELDPAVFYPKLVRTLSNNNFSWGLVGHVPEFIKKHLPFGSDLSVFYNKSDNFRVAPQRYTITNEALPAETGNTKEYGVRVSVLDGKVDFKVARYETIADKASVNSLTAALNQLADIAGIVVDRTYAGENAGNPAGIAAFENWYKGPFGTVYQQAFHYTAVNNTDATKPAATFGSFADLVGDRGQVTGTSALKSTGVELELGFNPTKNWRLEAHAASAKAVRTNIAPELYDFIFNPTNGILALVQNTNGTPTDAGRLFGAISGGQTFQQYVVSNILNNGITTTFAQAGTKTDELREWSYGGITNYTFDDTLFGGRLKGFAVGGGFRWGDKPIIGYAGTILTIAGNTLPAADITKPIFGKTETTFDLWFSYARKLNRRINWKAQLNIHNVGVGNELLPVQANPDGQVMVWRIREPQSITLSNTFEF